MKAYFILSMVIILFLSFIGCSDTPKTQPKVSAPVVQAPSVEYMTMAFGYPVMMVNGKTAGKTQDRIEISLPQNSRQDIVLQVVDSEGKNHELYGEIKTFQYSEYSKPKGEPSEVVLIFPEDPESTYATILNNGYGKFTVREQVMHPDLGESKGAVLLEMTLGTKKKSNRGLEFGFREGAIATVQGQKAPASFSFPAKSRQQLQLTLDEGIELVGDLEVYEGNEYTQWAPVWVTLDEKHKSILYEDGGILNMALYVPSPEAQKMGTSTIFLGPQQDPTLLAKKSGKLVGVLKLRRSR